MASSQKYHADFCQLRKNKGNFVTKGFSLKIILIRPKKKCVFQVTCKKKKKKWGR